MNKRGNVLDWFVILAVLFATGIAVFASFIMIDKVNTSGIFADDETAQLAIDKSKSTILSFDSLMLFIIVGLSIFVLVSSAVVYNHPAFFIVGLLLLFIAVMVAGVVSNAFWDFSNSNQILSTSAHFPKTTFLFNNLPFYVLFMGFASMITMFVSYNRQ